MRSPRAVLTASSLHELLVVVGHTMGRLADAGTFSVLEVQFGFTSLFEVVLISAFAVVAAAAYATSFFTFSLVLVCQLLPRSLHEGVLHPCVPGGRVSLR